MPLTTLLARDGRHIPLDLHRWHADVDDAEWTVLAPLPGPVLDIGCGPGRVAAAYATRGRPCLGIDPAPTAVRRARNRGVATLRRSVFEHVPGHGRWGAAVLLDGNIGIGGDPVALLLRVGELLRPGGRALVELAPPGQGVHRTDVRLDVDAEVVGPWFPWAFVAADLFAAVAGAAGLAAEPPRTLTGRWFAEAVRP